MFYSNNNFTYRQQQTKTLVETLPLHITTIPCFCLCLVSKVIRQPSGTQIDSPLFCFISPALRTVFSRSRLALGSLGGRLNHRSINSSPVNVCQGDARTPSLPTTLPFTPASAFSYQSFSCQGRDETEEKGGKNDTNHNERSWCYSARSRTKAIISRRGLRSGWRSETMWRKPSIGGNLSPSSWKLLSHSAVRHSSTWDTTGDVSVCWLVLGKERTTCLSRKRSRSILLMEKKMIIPAGVSFGQGHSHTGRLPRKRQMVDDFRGKIRIKRGMSFCRLFFTTTIRRGFLLALKNKCQKRPSLPAGTSKRRSGKRRAAGLNLTPSPQNAHGTISSMIDRFTHHRHRYGGGRGVVPSEQDERFLIDFFGK